MDYFEGQLTWLALKFFFYLLFGPSTLSLWLRKALSSVLLLLGKALFLVLKLFYYLLSGSSEGPSTILWLRKALFSVLKFLFYLSFGFPDGQPTLSICKKCAGVPRSPLTLNILRLANYIHKPLTQLLQYGNTLLQLLPLLAISVFSIVLYTYWAYILCRVIREELSSALLCSLYIFPSHFSVSFLISLSYRGFERRTARFSSYITLGCDQRNICEGNRCTLRTIASDSDLT